MLSTTAKSSERLLSRAFSIRWGLTTPTLRCPTLLQRTVRCMYSTPCLVLNRASLLELNICLLYVFYNFSLVSCCCVEVVPNARKDLKDVLGDRVAVPVKGSSIYGNRISYTET